MAQAVLGTAAQIPELKATFFENLRRSSSAQRQFKCWFGCLTEALRHGDLVPMFDDLPVPETEEVKILHTDLLSLRRHSE